MRKETCSAFPVSRIVRVRMAQLALILPAALFSGIEVNLEAGLLFVCFVCFWWNTSSLGSQSY